MLSAVSSVGGIRKFFLAEYPFCELPFAVWEGQHFNDFRLPKYFKSLADAQEEIERRMNKLRQKHLKKYARKLEENDRIIIKTFST